MSSFCYNCYKEYSGEGYCPYCGFNNELAREKYPFALPYGTVLGGKYIVGRVLGQGGFGITYLAQDYRDKKIVAVKEYYPEQWAMRSGGTEVSTFSGEKEEAFHYGKVCFLSEAKTLAEFIGNPNIVRVYSYFEENCTAYFAMEYIDGISLKEYLERHGGRIGYEEAKNLLLPVMDALSAVHAKGMIHRDISPDNIFIRGDGCVKLIDFGAARYSIGDRSRSLDVVLKHGYAPREQYARHGRQGPFTDVYSLAATFYRCITGRIPPDSIDRIDEDTLVDPSTLGCVIPTQAEDALIKALSVNPADRFRSMQEFRDMILSSSSAGARVPSPSPAPVPPRDTAPSSSGISSAPDADRLVKPAEPPVTPPVPTPDPSARRQNTTLKIVIALLAVLAVAVIILLVVLLNGSSDKGRSDDPTPAPTRSNVTDDPVIPATEPVTEPITEAPTPTEDPGVDVNPSAFIRYSFPEFSIELPDEITFEKGYDSNGNPYVTFYDEYNNDIGKKSFGISNFGRLATIHVLPTRETSYTFAENLPKGDWLGNYNGLFLVVEYPTDVQWDMNDARAESVYRNRQIIMEDMIETIR